MTKKPSEQGCVLALIFFRELLCDDEEDGCVDLHDKDYRETPD